VLSWSKKLFLASYFFSTTGKLVVSNALSAEGNSYEGTELDEAAAAASVDEAGAAGAADAAFAYEVGVAFSKRALDACRSNSCLFSSTL
jgi:hypothetical protein